jgi:nitronate monooxygenase
VEADELSTTLILRSLRNTGRVLKNAVSEAVVELETRPGGAEFSEIHPYVAGARGREALENGDSEAGLVWASQICGLIEDIPTCAELIDRMVRECREHLAAANRAVA